MMDVNRVSFNDTIDLTFIEPYPEERFDKIVENRSNFKLIKSFIQDVPLALFDTLEKDDVLFVESSHVGKYKSDVLFILFKVLPKLKAGVIIHFHDVFYPFEYPYAWLKEGRFWNESYFLRAFLMYNSQFEILFFSSYMETKHNDWYKKNMPKCLIESYTVNIEGKELPTKTKGQSIYLVKTIGHK